MQTALRYYIPPLKVEIYLNEVHRVSSYSGFNMTLLYDKAKLEGNLDAYVSEQLEAHKKYHEFIKEDLSKGYKLLNNILEEEREVLWSLKFVPENLSNALIESYKIIDAIIQAFKFTTSKRERMKTIKYYKEQVACYESLKDLIGRVIENGTKLFKDYLEKNKNKISDESKFKLEECVKIANDILYLYSNLTRTWQKMLEAHQREYNLLFPPK